MSLKISTRPKERSYVRNQLDTDKLTFPPGSKKSERFRFKHYVFEFVAYIRWKNKMN